jgi:integrase
VDQDPRGGLAASTLYNQFKSFFGDCASVLRHQGDGKGAERFDKASSHWLRHTHASHAIASGMPIEIAQQNLGHASLATTTIYLTTEQRRRMQAVQGFWAAASPASTAAAGPVPAHSSEPTGKEGLR